MAALNFPDPNVTTSYTNPDTGITYEWSNGIWKAVRTAQTAPELFVDADGDNLTGNLTLGTDKIVLNATDGSAEFAGNVAIGEDSGATLEVFQYDGSQNNNGIQLLSNGFSSVLTVQNKTLVPTTTDVFKILRGTATTAAIKADGSATFGEAVICLNDPTNGASNGTRLGSTVQVATLNGSDPVWYGYTVGTSTPTSEIKADGSALFAGGVTAGGAIRMGDISQVNPTAGGAAFAYDDSVKSTKVYANSSTNVGASVDFHFNGSTTSAASIGQDGSATFAAGVVSTGNDVSSGITVNTTAAGKGVTVLGSSGGDIRLKGDGSATFGHSSAQQVNLRPGQVGNGDAIWLQNSDNSRPFLVTAEGSATFANTLSVTGGGISLQYGPFELYAGNPFEKKISLNTDGSATFAGYVKSIGFSCVDGVVNNGGVNLSAGRLDIRQDGSNPVIQLYHGSNTNVSTSLNGDGSAYFASNMGIGTQSPANRFVVFGPSSTGDSSHDNVAEFAGPSRTNGFQVFVNDTDNNSGIQTKNADDLVINPHGGRVAIGTSSMGADLSIGNFDGNEGIILQSASSYSGYIYFADGSTGTDTYRGYLQYNHSGDYLQIGTDSKERVRIRSNGRFGAIMDATDGHNFFSTHPSDSNINLLVGVHSATTLDNGTASFVIHTNGTYTTLSDEAHKKNIVTTRNGYLEDLNKLRVVKYNWKEQDDGEPKELGLIAQEVEQVFPGLVEETKVGDGDASKGIKVSVLNYMLLKALQEASAKIETLEQRLTDAGIA